MVASRTALYQAHVKNVRAIQTAIKKLRRELNASLARGDGKTADALLKTLMLLLGALAENRLNKLLHEPGGFSSAQIISVLDQTSQIDRWNKALEIGFRHRHNIPAADLALALDITPRSHFSAIREVLNNDIGPIIEVRNKLAHGQWARTLNNDNSDFSPEGMARVNGENALTYKCKLRLLGCVADLIHDLVAGNQAFERDFDSHFRSLEGAKRDMRNRNYDLWLAAMRDKKARRRS